MLSQSEYNLQFSDMVKRHEKIIFSVCFFYATTDTPFDDLRQEVLISLFKGFRNFMGQSAESTWVYKVCINTCLFAQRRFARTVKTVSIDEISGINIPADSDDDFVHKLQWLHAAIGELNSMEKAIILMWLDELSYDEIALNMGIPRNTVASRLSRIKMKLSAKKDK